MPYGIVKEFTVTAYGPAFLAAVLSEIIVCRTLHAHLQYGKSFP
jgi:hypothetical protein